MIYSFRKFLSLRVPTPLGFYYHSGVKSCALPGRAGARVAHTSGGELFEVLAEEALYLVEGYFVHSVVEVRVAGTGDDVELAV